MFEAEHDRLVKSKTWIANATYRTKGGTKLKEKELLAAIAADEKLVEERLDSGFCTQK